VVDEGTTAFFSDSYTLSIFVYYFFNLERLEATAIRSNLDCICHPLAPELGSSIKVMAW